MQNAKHSTPVKLKNRIDECGLIDYVGLIGLFNFCDGIVVTYAVIYNTRVVLCIVLSLSFPELVDTHQSELIHRKIIWA